jgi:Cdc6-like AAA superfamily ATPase
MPSVTRHFVNRTNEIGQLNTALNSEGSEKDSFILVYGQTGIGKTQLLAKYLRECNDRRVRIAYVDLENLVTKGYLGLIEAIVEGLGNDGFEDLDKTYDDILLRLQFEKSASASAAQQLTADADALLKSDSGPVTNFYGNLSAEKQIFINGAVSFNDAKINNIYNFHLAEPAQVAELNQNKITRVFGNCLRNIAAEQLIVVLFDQWEKASDPLKIWLNDHLLRWATELTLKKALIVLSREAIPPELQDQMGILPLAIPPFSREVALDFWKKNGLTEEEFNSIGVEIYSVPGILSLVVGKQRLKQGKV